MKLKQGEDLLKYVTERTIQYIETPKEVRKQNHSGSKEPWEYRWFGLIPLAIHLWFKNKKKHK